MSNVRKHQVEAAVFIFDDFPSSYFHFVLSSVNLLKTLKNDTFVQKTEYSVGWPFVEFHCAVTKTPGRV